ncbi:hypothetical protein TanjilG_22894 [Lupinus angustifolius]|uniref:C2H2-type domain-containing protein n=1 Tax=Lupinus angustifolius TaxID=3871 RepID=A0A4P1RIG4_LUPAN|nr:PREDICTED: zinc finger protein 282-like [Lupinus angustifolius]OIW11087.1 hypothetical protein TanjilG_22894 [Lupinus angustifolius]
MKNPNHPSGDSNTDRKSPSSSPPQPPLPPSDDNDNSRGRRGRQEATTIMKTALQVLAELASDDSTNDGGGEGSGGGGVASMELAVGGGVGGSTVVVQEGVGGSGNQGKRAGKKRKSSDVKDPPSGKPCCPLCHKEFNSWKGAFGHMRKHPERGYRGFHKPPSFSTPSSLHARNQGDGEGNSTSSQPVGGVLFDLNEPLTAEAESSNADAERNEAPVSPPHPRPRAEENKLGFDLNELPGDDDNEDN